MATLQTFTNSSINKISDKLKKYLDERPLTGTVKYRMLNGTVNLDPKAIKGKNDILYPSVLQLWLKSKIKDPDGTGYIEVAVLKDFDERTNTPAYAYKMIHGYERGLMVLHEGIMDEEEMYPVIELMNENGSNPFRDKANAPLFERIDLLKDADNEVELTDKLYNALRAIDLMPIGDQRLIHAGNGGSVDDDPKLVKVALLKMAKKDPVWFTAMVDSPLTKIKALVREGLEKGIIQYDMQQHRYLWISNQMTIVSLDRIEGTDNEGQFADWLNSNPTGDQVKNQLRNLIDPEVKKKK